MPTPPCTYCGRADAPTRACGGCYNVHFCSPDCQKANWKAGHKEACKKTQAGAEEVYDLPADPSNEEEVMLEKNLQISRNRNASYNERGLAWNVISTKLRLGGLTSMRRIGQMVGGYAAVLEMMEEEIELGPKKLGSSDHHQLLGGIMLGKFTHLTTAPRADPVCSVGVVRQRDGQAWAVLLKYLDVVLACWKHKGYPDDVEYELRTLLRQLVNVSYLQEPVLYALEVLQADLEVSGKPLCKILGKAMDLKNMSDPCEGLTNTLVANIALFADSLAYGPAIERAILDHAGLSRSAVMMYQNMAKPQAKKAIGTKGLLPNPKLAGMNSSAAAMRAAAAAGGMRAGSIATEWVEQGLITAEEAGVTEKMLKELRKVRLEEEVLNIRRPGGRR